MGTIIAGIVLLLAVGVAIFQTIKRKKQGKGCCDGNCNHCGGGDCR